MTQSLISWHGTNSASRSRSGHSRGVISWRRREINFCPAGISWRVPRNSAPVSPLPPSVFAAVFVGRCGYYPGYWPAWDQRTLKLRQRMVEPVSLSELIYQHVRIAIETDVHEELRAALGTKPLRAQ